MNNSNSNSDSDHLHEFLYCSLLAPEEQVAVVPQILAQARACNARLGVTGVLVFDGQRFCQHLEGPAHATKALMSRIAADARHTRLQLLYSADLVARRHESFAMGYAQPEDGDLIAALAERSGPAALRDFLALRPRLDLSA